MRSSRRIGAVLAVVIASLAYAAESRAAILVNPNPPPAPYTVSLADWITAGAVQDQDKIWTITGTTLPVADTTAVFATDEIVPGVLDLHTLSLQFTPHLLGPAAYTLDYTISIDPMLSPNFQFDQAGLDSTIALATVTVTKDISGLLTLTSADGSSTGLQSLPAGYTTLTVHETFTLGPTGDLVNVTNTFTEIAAVPEPATFLIWLGLGAVGLVLGGRRRM